MSFPAAGDLNATWSFIEPCLEYILGAHGADQGVDAKLYMNCYTAVYNYCVNKSRLQDAQFRLSGTKTSESHSLNGGEMYICLSEYLQHFVEKLTQKPDEQFLEFYVRKWSRYTIGVGYLNNVFDYMNRYWVQKERNDAQNKIYEVNTLALVQWKYYMFDKHSNTLIQEILKEIEKQRNNEVVDTYLISAAIKSLVHLGVEQNENKKPNLHVYISMFEQVFLSKTKDYYVRESQNFLSQYSVVDYLRKCETRFAEEISRSNNYLEDHTKKLLVEVLNEALIQDHAEELYAQFIPLLERNEIDEIQRMYKLLSRVKSTLPPLAHRFETYLKSQALQALENIKKAEQEAAMAANAAAGAPKKAPTGVVPPKVYIHTLIEIYVHFNDILTRAFNRDTVFVKALDNACRYFVNNNPIALPSPRSPCKTPDYLARYADAFLKSNSKEADVVDMNADNLMIIFPFLEDKDAFEEHYRRLLAKRLINGNCKSEEAEEQIIQKLQTANSLEYTSKMTKMFSDMRASAELKYHNSEDFKDFTPLILAQSMWPFKHVPDYSLKLAPELLDAFTNIESVYQSRHTGRELKWLWNHGRAEVKANLSRKGKAPFIFTVSNVQLMILLAFNKEKTYTYDQLRDIIGVAPYIFDAHLTPFIKGKLLEQKPAGSDHMNSADTTFTIVDEYKSKKSRVNFVSSIKTEQRVEEEETNKVIDEARKDYLSASIVRTMKARKQMKHKDLINEVIQQSVSRFRAKISDVKHAIDYLIEKEYIKRINNDAYEYLA